VPYSEKGLYGFRDASGRVVISPRYAYACALNDNRARVISDTVDAASGINWSYIDRDGRTVIRGPFLRAQDFSEGLAWVLLDNQVLLIDTNGLVLSKGDWNGAKPFSEGLAAVSIGGDWFGCGGTWGYVNRAGEYTVQPRFTSADGFCDGLAVVSTGGVWRHEGVGGMSLVRAQYGVVDATGRYVVLPEWRKIQRTPSRTFVLEKGK
jgi:hypothetical protein